MGEPFGTFCVNFVHFSGFGIMYKKNLATLGGGTSAFFGCTSLNKNTSS
jgi:hypothetical protein